MAQHLKKKSALVWCGLLLALAVAVPSAQLMADEKLVHGYTMEEALETAMKENAEIRMIDERIALAEARHKDAVDDAKYAKNRHSNDRLQDAEYRKQELVLPLSTETTLLELKQQKEDLLLEVRLQVEGIFYQYSLLQDQHTTLQDEINNANTKYEAQKKLVETGKAVESSLDSIEIELLRLQQRMNDLRSQQELLMIDLSQATGLDQSNFVSLVPVDVPEVSYSLDDVAALSRTIRDTHTIVSLAETKVEIASREYDILQKAYYQDEDLLNELESAEDAAFSARLALRDAQDQAEVKVRSDYNTILNGLDAVEIAALDRDRSLIQLEITEKRHSLGMVTDIERSQARIQAQSAEAALVQARINAYNAVERFKHYISQVTESESE